MRMPPTWRSHVPVVFGVPAARAVRTAIAVPVDLGLLPAEAPCSTRPGVAPRRVAAARVDAPGHRAQPGPGRTHRPTGLHAPGQQHLVVGAGSGLAPVPCAGAVSKRLLRPTAVVLPVSLPDLAAACDGCHAAARRTGRPAAGHRPGGATQCPGAGAATRRRGAAGPRFHRPGDGPGPGAAGQSGGRGGLGSQPGGRPGQQVGLEGACHTSGVDTPCISLPACPPPLIAPLPSPRGFVGHHPCAPSGSQLHGPCSQRGGPLAPSADPVAGWSSPVARRAHNPKVVGSNPAPASTSTPSPTTEAGLSFVRPARSGARGFQPGNRRLTESPSPAGRIALCRRGSCMIRWLKACSACVAASSGRAGTAVLPPHNVLSARSRPPGRTRGRAASRAWR